jgi:hypothetical protein
MGFVRPEHLCVAGKAKKKAQPWPALADEKDKRQEAQAHPASTSFEKVSERRPERMIDQGCGLHELWPSAF